MRPRISYHPRVEALESRLQPGSIIPTQGNGWSLLGDNLLDASEDSWHPQGLVYSSAEYPKANQLDAAEQVIATALVPQSPVGVAAAAPAVAAAQSKESEIGLTVPVQSASGQREVLVPILPIDSGTVHAMAGYRTSNDVHVDSVAFANRLTHFGGGAGNQATLNFLSYLGGAGPDSINSIAVRKENGANSIYLTGLFTDGNGRTDAFAAKLTDGATAVVWAVALRLPTPGPDRASSLALAGSSVYLAGSLANPAAPGGSDGFVAQLDANTGTVSSFGILPNASLAAVTTDAAGNVYVAGSTPDPNNATQQDIALLKATSDLLNTTYSAFIRYQSANGTSATSSVTTGSGLLVDGQGDIYFAGGIGLLGDPSNNIEPAFGWLNDTAGLALYATIAAPNPSPGPRGMGTAVALDPQGNLVFTGSLNDTGSGPVTHGNPTVLDQDLLLGRVQPTFRPVVDSQGNVSYKPVLAVVDAILWYVDDRALAQSRVGDWTSNGLVVLADGSSIVTGAAYDPAAPNRPPLSLPSNGIDVHLTHFTPTDDNTVNTQNSDGDPENIFGGSGVDVGMAVALDRTKPTNVYVAGSTTSNDLPTTSGVVQPSYGGRAGTGFVGQASVQ